MVTDNQVRRLFKLKNTEKSIADAAMKAGMCENTARKFIQLCKLPSHLEIERTHRTRKDPFERDWLEIKEFLISIPGLESKTLFQYLQREKPGRYQDGQLRTLQRRIRQWRALEGDPKEVFFDQIHRPGELCQSDFTDISQLSITIKGELFSHLIYHFVLTYSNWETGTICFSESFESLSDGIQNALWELGGVPVKHQTDRLTAAVQSIPRPEKLTKDYEELMTHYRIAAKYGQAAKPNENGDVEKSNHGFKRTLNQALLLRGTRDFESRKEYEAFLRKLFSQLNAGRRERLKEEMKVLRELPERRTEACKKFEARVRQGSTITIQHNVYSVNSRLIGEKVKVRLYAEHLEVWYAQRKIEAIPRLHGRGKHRINYRHIISWLVRKPGAFENYRYRNDLYPNTRFRIAYDWLQKNNPTRANKEYLKILYLAASETELGVDGVLQNIIDTGQGFDFEDIKEKVTSGQKFHKVTDVEICEIQLVSFDTLIPSMVI
ncbi:IS21 family transposase [bacterium]|nr:IS21 family transposase [bacterium]